MKLANPNLLKSGLVLGLLSVGVYACGQSNGGGGGTGGSSSGGTASGGHTGSGGATSAGGTTTSGGTTGSGGTHETGGTVGSGGHVSSGGATGTGGTPGTGGTTKVGSGGSGSGGSSTGSGGSAGNATGGAGGILGSGGAPASGGVPGSGGGGVDAGNRDSAADSSNTGGVGTGGTGAGGSTSPGTCPSGAKPTDGTKKITVGTLNREYILHVPSAYKGDSPAPLVLDFHPLGGSDSSWRTGSPYPAVIDSEGVISAFPNGQSGPSGQAWNVQGCCVASDIDDVAFAKAIVQDIEKVACIDTKRIYAVGFSMGGGMSNWLACKAADIFAAVGPASFDLTKQNEPDCKPSRPLTVIEWRGKNDTVVPYDGGHSAVVSGMAIDFLGAVGTFKEWATLDGCTGSPSAADSNGCQTYSTCSAGVQVTLCTDASGGHEAANAKIVWPWLKKYTMP